MLTVRTKRTLIGAAFALLLAVTLVVAIGRYFAGRAQERQLAAERAALRAPEPLIITVKQETRHRLRQLPARAEAWWRTTLAAEIGGRVQWIAAEPGMAVTKGDVLVELDATVAAAGAEVAESAWREAGRRLREIERLAAERVTAASDLEAARAAEEMAAREADRARAMVAQYRLRAPFDGRVSARFAEPGTFLGVGQPALELVAVDPLRIVFHAAELEILSLAGTETIRVTFPALPGREFQAPILHRSPAASPGGLFRIEAQLPNPDGAIPAGLAATATVKIASYEHVLFVPAAAVRFEGSRPVVRRIDGDGREETVEIEFDPEVNGSYPVRRGLREGDRLVVR